MEFLNKIEKIGRSLYNMTNLDMLFIDNNNEIQISYGHFYVPALLKPYLRNLYKTLDIGTAVGDEKIILYKTSYKLNFLSCRISQQGKGIGACRW